MKFRRREIRSVMRKNRLGIRFRRFFEIVVGTAENGSVSETEVIAFGESGIAHGAGETVDVEDEISRSHHEFRR